jgi:hypothetical protein
MNFCLHQRRTWPGNDNKLTSKDDYRKIKNEVQSHGEKNKTGTAWTCTLGDNICEHLKATERKILRIYGAIYSNGHWIIRYNYKLQTLYEDVGTVTLIGEDWIGLVTSIGWISQKSSKLSTVNMRIQEKEEDQDLDEGNVFGQILRREELRTWGKNLGIGMNGRRPLRRRSSIWDCRSNYEEQ